MMQFHMGSQGFSVSVSFRAELTIVRERFVNALMGRRHMCVKRPSVTKCFSAPLTSLLLVVMFPRCRLPEQLLVAALEVVVQVARMVDQVDID